MADAHEPVDTAIREIDRAQSRARSRLVRQVSTAEEKDYFKSVVYAWTRTHRVLVRANSATADLTDVDDGYRRILTATSKNAARTTYIDALKDAKSALVELRSSLLLPAAADSAAPTSDIAPDFSSLASDPTMQDILKRRWEECQRCLSANAHLAATVMMGGLLEALFVSRANKMSDKSPLFKAKTTPIDSRTRKPLPLTDWTLRPFIDVGHELKWITKSGKDVAEILRDYRNYVHPEKERSHGVALGQSDSSMFWEITKLLTRQLLS